MSSLREQEQLHLFSASLRRFYSPLLTSRTLIRLCSLRDLLSPLIKQNVLLAAVSYQQPLNPDRLNGDNVREKITAFTALIGKD
jgi:hypothetical protein